MSELTGDSQSSIVSGLLGVSVPVFERVVAALEAASTIQDSAREEIAAGLVRAQDKLEAQLGLVLGNLDEGVRPILEQAEKVKRRSRRLDGGRGAAAAGRGDLGGSTPVPVTRGSGSTAEVKKGTVKGVRRGRV
jgi:hypothetical protein